MRLAYCLHGLAGGCGGKNGAGEPVDIEVCKQSVAKKIFKYVDQVNVFIHSWSVDRKDEILKLYQPADYLIEEQKIFSKDHGKQIANSRWYTLAESIRLKTEYEDLHNFVYDCVMTSRFDVIWHNPLVLKNYDMQYFWASLAPNMNEFGTGKKRGLYLEDFWFFSSSWNMNFLAGIKDRVVSKNNHKTLFNFLNCNVDIQITHSPPGDFDLYRWWAGKCDDHPHKWYK